jgi:CTD kinase subunit alpha
MWAGSLRDITQGSYTGPPVGDRREIARQIVNGLDYLHRKGVFHGALKPSNILISHPDGSVPPMLKLANFAFVRVSKSRQSLPLWKKVLGSGSSKSWMAPEIYSSNFYTVEMDTFALGCVIGFSLTGGRHIFGAEKKQERIMRIFNKEPMTLTIQDLKNIPGARQVLDLICAMVNPDTSKRPTVSDVLEHPFFVQTIRKRQRENDPISRGKYIHYRNIQIASNKFTFFVLQSHWIKTAS